MKTIDHLSLHALTVRILRAGGIVAHRRHAGVLLVVGEALACAVRVGEAAITGAGRLRARYVIHAASMSLGGRTTRGALKSSMDDVFRLARMHEVRTLAVPAVGTGIAGFPIDECARVMAESLKAALTQGWRASEVRFVLFGEDAKTPFEAAFWTVFHAPLGNSD